jgi:2'-5' RNA ligase
VHAALPASLLVKAHTPAGETGTPSPEPRYTYGSTQCAMPPDLARALMAFARDIPEEHLGIDGREDAPHVTVKYGLLQTDRAAERRLRALCRTVPPIEIRLGKTSVFPASEGGSAQDVLKIDVDSPALRDLNKRIAAVVPCADTHPVYRPHVTLAYVGRGLGERYTGNRTFEGRRVVLDTLVLSNQQGEQVAIPLTGKVPNYPGSMALTTLATDNAVETEALAKAMIHRPGSHGAMLWHYDASGKVVYGPMEPAKPPPPLPAQQPPPTSSAGDESSPGGTGSTPGQAAPAASAQSTSSPPPASPPATAPSVSVTGGGPPPSAPPPDSPPPPQGKPRAHEPGQDGEQPTLRAVRETDRALRTLLHTVPTDRLPADLHTLLSFPAGSQVPGPLAPESTDLLARVRLTEAQVRDWRNTALVALALARGERLGASGAHVAPALVRAARAGAWPAQDTPSPSARETAPGACICCPWWQQTIGQLLTLSSSPPS